MLIMVLNVRIQLLFLISLNPNTKSVHKLGCHDEIEHNKRHTTAARDKVYFCMPKKMKKKSNGGFSFYLNDYPANGGISEAHHITVCGQNPSQSPFFTMKFFDLRLTRCNMFENYNIIQTCINKNIFYGYGYGNTLCSYKVRQDQLFFKLLIN